MHGLWILSSACSKTAGTTSSSGASVLFYTVLQVAHTQTAETLQLQCRCMYCTE
ncbi:hypothetical protein PF004_g10064 [Phytophthora fragariae]|uniref:Uncharacterized protein n=1 Tax=Phytophthora fragariae TaxID=53985 RepID=A0A6G0P274_9STRA|nr:hypothetical protein PF004_g10064 [Phytophthora fragariae]